MKKKKQEEAVPQTEELAVREKKPGFFAKRKEKRSRKKQIWKEMEPAKRKKKIRKRILISAAAVIVVFIVVSNLMKGNAALPVSTVVVKKGNVEAAISTSGTVKSEKVKTYFSDVDSKVGTIAASLGEEVRKGNKVIAYNESEIELASEKAQLETTASRKGYEAMASDNSKYRNQLSSASTTIEQFKELITQQEAIVKQMEDSIDDEVVKKRAKLYDRQYEIQKYINDHQHQLAITDPSSSVYTNTQDNLYKLQNDLQKVTNDLTQLQDYKTADNREDALVKAKKDLTDMQTIYEEAKAEKNAAKNSVMNKSKLEESKANSDMNALLAQDRVDKLEQAQNGVIAEFDGIITSIDVVEGAPVTSAGTKLFTLESSKEVKVEISVSKYDLEQLKKGQHATVTIAGSSYEGTLSKINRMATPNASGTPVVTAEIHIIKPDASVYLGLEAKVSIDTAKAENVLTVPMEAVNADKEGDFCYVLENETIVRKNIVIGITSDESIEIKEGLKEGDQVVIGSTNLAEGTRAIAVPAE